MNCDFHVVFFPANSQNDSQETREEKILNFCGKFQNGDAIFDIIICVTFFEFAMNKYSNSVATGDFAILFAIC